MQGLTLIDWLFMLSMITFWIILLYHIVLAYAGYGCFIKSSSLGADPEALTHSRPKVTILVPAHNEERVIGRTVDALAKLNYPEELLEIIVINDSSTDGTGEVLAEKQRYYKQLRVLTIEPPLGAKGKSNALNQGLRIASGDYIAVYDADNTPERESLAILMTALLKDDVLGAVVGKFRTRNRDTSLLTRFINIETLSFQWLVQAGRSHLFGLTTIPGTNFVIRRKILEDIGGWNVAALTEDTELTIRVYESGYRILWVPTAVTWEQEPEKLRIWLRQRTRWARGNLWVIATNASKIIFPKNVRIAGDILYFLFTYTVFFLSVIMADVIFLLGVTGVAKVTLHGPLLIIWLLAYLLFILEIFIALSLERGEATVLNLLITSIMYFTYCQLWLYVLFRALWVALRDKLVGASFYWYKTERSEG